VRAALDQEEIRSSLLSVVSESLHDDIHERSLAVCTDSVEYCEDLLRDLASGSVAHDPLDEALQGFAWQYLLQELRERVRVGLRV
jgi:heme oxygenase